MSLLKKIASTIMSSMIYKEQVQCGYVDAMTGEVHW